MSAQYLKTFGDQTWRLENLYYITNEKGSKVKFKFKKAQREFFSHLHFKNIVLKARQLGFSTAIDIFMLDMALFYPNTSCGLIAHTLKDAQKLFANKILYAYDNLPDVIKAQVGYVTRNSTEIVFSNGSSISVGVSLRSGTYQFLHISEFGKISVANPARAEEVVTGALNTQEPEGWCFIESTAEGQDGRFYNYVQDAREFENTKQVLTPMTYKFHFFPWYDDPKYTLDAEVIITPENDKYLKDYETRGIKLTDGQKAWWVVKKKEMGDKMGREFPTYPEEAFATALDGSYYGSLITKAERDGRIRDISYEPMLEVETHWDIGMSDSTCIWFVQRHGNEIRVIDYYENSGEGLAHYARILKEKAIDGNWRYSRHVGPHDSNVREWTRDGKTRREVAEELGLKPWVITNKLGLNEGIDAVRAILPRCYFDITKCATGLKALKAYKKEWNDKLGAWHNRPLHDWASHASDAFRTMATAPTIVHDNVWANVEHISVPDTGLW